MTDRILDFSLHPVRLSISNSLLVIRRDGEQDLSIPCAEIAAILLAHPQISLSQSVLSHLAQAGAIVVACDQRSTPAAMMLPLDAHWIQAARFRQQAALSLPAQKRLWQQVVRAKLVAQSRLLVEATGNHHGLQPMAAHVLSGDSSNAEAIAARRYWLKLFDQNRFRRWDQDDPRHHLLNYGYAVLRALVARALCASGLHPAFGIHHSNVMNSFALADDFMEPFRPLVDRAVWLLESSHAPLDLNPENKGVLIQAATARILVENESRTLFDVLSRLTSSFVKVLAAEQKTLWLPTYEPAS